MGALSSKELNSLEAVFFLWGKKYQLFYFDV